MARLAVILALLALTAACVDITPSSPAATRPSALDDPMNYRPNFNDADVSGGGLNEINRDALRRDLKELLDP